MISFMESVKIDLKSSTNRASAGQHFFYIASTLVSGLILSVGGCKPPKGVGGADHEVRIIWLRLIAERLACGGQFAQ